jgi:hypothetical protein
MELNLEWAAGTLAHSTVCKLYAESLLKRRAFADFCSIWNDTGLTHGPIARILFPAFVGPNHVV